MSTGKSSILIIDDHPAIREGMSRIINATDDLMVCAAASDRAGALAEVLNNHPDAVLLDISLGLKCGSGLDLIPEIHGLAGIIPILVVSMHSEALYMERAMKAGAAAYLTKQEPVEEIIRTLRSVLAADSCASEATSSGREHKTEAESSLDKLGRREFEVFRLVGQGLSPRSIAQALSLSIKTVESHKANIRKKLNMKTAEELTVFAISTFRMQGEALVQNNEKEEESRI